MNDVERATKRRNRTIARNESERLVGSNIRLSVWAVTVALVIVLLGWLWMRQ